MRISPHPRCAYIPPLSFTVADVPLAQKDKDVTCRYYAVHAGVLDRLTDDPQPTCVNHVSCRSDSEQFGVSKPRPLFIEQRTRVRADYFCEVPEGNISTSPSRVQTRVPQISR